MRYNEKELQALSRQPAEMAAELGMRGPKKGSVAKRRLVKLVVNFLFYFRPDEAEPLGALLLERCRVAQEEPGGFSISFVEDLSRKYHFECCSQEQCQEWMEALRRARNEIRKMTGKAPCTPQDPLEQFGISEEARFQLNSLPRDEQTCTGSQLGVLD
ncbi:pleckstrin homology domain-containing family J member 1 isoform X4 [Cricetulus griseus]|uniref:Pleckstrin homology domain-containing family J member 1 n=1 Tax=Cricetulus griseus TaxID=10029 RepID=A0A9J7G2A3_CRIGR|nr:pleckstrin homology domain-containing family J member 1 isoform X4 [Cricetulus griseus]